MVMVDMTAAVLPLLAHLLFTQVAPVLSHARFLEPPSRASMWRMGFEAPVDYQDHEGSCGGLFYQWLANGGRCGICGDRWDNWPRPHERGGRFATGGIVRRYRRGQIISTVVEVTTAHRGYMEFRICELSDEQPEATQPCLNRNLLRLADGSGTKYRVGEKSEMARVKLRLPTDLTCTHCIIQWRYRTGNNWGICPDGSSQLGCGPQEEFRGCSDVAVLPRDSDSDSDSATTGPSATSAGGLRRPSDLTGPSGEVRRPSDLTGPSGGLRRPSVLTSGPRRPSDFTSPTGLTGPSLDAAGRPPTGFRRPSELTRPSLPSRRPSEPQPVDFNQLSDLTGPSSPQTFSRPSLPSRRPSKPQPVDFNQLSDLTGPSSPQTFSRPSGTRPSEFTAPSGLSGSSAGRQRRPDQRQPPPRSRYHHRPYETMTRRNRTAVPTDTGRVPTDDFDDGFIDIDDSFVDDDGNFFDNDGGSASPDSGFIDTDDGFVDTDELEEVDLRDLESLGEGDIPTVFDGDNSIDDAPDSPLRLSGLRGGKQLGGLTPSDTTCHAVGIWVTVPGMDDWCLTNCLAEPMPSCPEGMCQCDGAEAVPPRPSLQLLQGSLPRRPPPPPQQQQTTAELPQPQPAADSDTVQALLTELATLRRERLRYQAARGGRGGRGRLPTSGQLTYLAPSDDTAVTEAPASGGSRATSARGPARPFYFAPPTTQRTAPLTEQPPPVTDEVERFPPAAVTGPFQDDLRPVTLRPANLVTTTEDATEAEAELLPAELVDQERQRGRLRRLERLRQRLRLQQDREQQQQEREMQQQEREKQQQRKKQKYQQQKQQKQRQQQLVQQQQLAQQRLEEQQQQQQQLEQQLEQQQQPQVAGDDAPQWETSVQCTAVVPWRFMSGVTKWCTDNCLGRVRPTCPVTICACTNARVTISNPAVEDGRNRTLMQITHKGNRAKIVLNGVGTAAPGSSGGGDGGEAEKNASRSTTLYFKARAPGFLFFIQPIDREGGTARGRPQSARAIVVPMGQSVDRQQARQAATEVLRRQRITGRPAAAAVSLASASTVSPRTLPPRDGRATAAAAAATLQRQQQEELYRNIGLLATARGRGRALAATVDSGTTEVVPLNPSPGFDHDPPGDTSTVTAAGAGAGAAGAGAAQRRSDSTRKRVANCRGVGKFRHSFAMDYWCEVNCASEKVRNCPKNLCECRGYARLQNV